MQEKYKGYEAVKCSNASWRDYNNSKQPLEYYRLELITPYPAEISKEDLYKRLRCDLSEVFGEIWDDSLINTNRRAFQMVRAGTAQVGTDHGVQPMQYEYNCFGSNYRINFKQKRWEVTLFLHELFLGFPDGENE